MVGFEGRFRELQGAMPVETEKTPPIAFTGLLSVVVPVFDEADTLPDFRSRLVGVLDGMGIEWEIIFVNDGSRDSSLECLDAFAAEDPRIAILDLTRNFGKEVALTAGIDQAKGDAVAVLDADLQDPPELIPDLLAELKDGIEVVCAQRTARHGERWFKRATAAGFYRLMEHVGPVSMPRNVGDYRVMSRDAAAAVSRLREYHRFMKGLFAWVGFRQKMVPYERDPRFAGDSKWSYWRLWNLSLEGITSFTFAPLRFSTYLGILTAGVAFLYALYFILKTLLVGDPVPGFPTLIVVILFLGGVQLMVLGIIGEYLGRVFNETKRRPLYLAREFRASDREGTPLLDEAGGDAPVLRRTPPRN